MATNAEAREVALEARENAKESASEFNDKAADAANGARQWAGAFIDGAVDTAKGAGTVLQGEGLLAGEAIAGGLGKAKGLVHGLNSTISGGLHDVFQFFADNSGEYSDSEKHKADTAEADMREGYETAVYGDDKSEQKPKKDVDSAIEKSQSKGMGKTFEA